mgnify:CR=1 FL=1|jgi:glutaredoxin
MQKVKDDEKYVLNVDIDVLFKNEKDAPAKTTMQAVQDYFWDLTGERTVPRTFLDGKTIGGFEDVMKLEESGQLSEMMTKLELE